MLVFDRNDPLEKHRYEHFRDSDKLSLREVSWISLGRFVLTILLRIGFFLVQIGSVPVTNVNLILVENIIDFAWITIVYAIAGYMVAYNGDIAGLIGQGQWIGDDRIVDKEEILVGWQATIIASAICTSCLAGRTRTIGYLVIGLIMAGVVQPLAIHWIWTTGGWMITDNFLSRNAAFRDFGGSTIVHTIGSLTGYIGCAILGRRIIRLRDIDEASIPADSAGTAIAGYFFILLGLQSLCFPSPTTINPRTSDKELSLIIVNNLLSASSCSLTVVALHFIFGRKEHLDHWTVMRCVQASIAGTTIVSAGVNFYNPIFCLGLGFTGGIVHYLVSRKVFQSALEDYCNVVATHLVCSIIGTLFVPFGRMTHESIKDPIAILVDVGWQVICLIVIVALVTLPMSLAFGLLECFGLLRNTPEIANHLRAVVAAQRGPSRSYMQRLFLPEGEIRYLQPSTVHIQSPNENIIPRVLNRQLSTNKIHKPQEFMENIGKSINPEVFLSTANQNVVERSTRVKKLRHVHTLKSMSDMRILKNEEHPKTMGDDYKSDKDEKINSTNVDRNFCKIEKHSMIECGGDSLTRISKMHDDSLVKNFSAPGPMEIKHDVTKINDSSEKNLKRRHGPYSLHRTQKSMNLRLEAIEENDKIVKFLVEPSVQSFSSTESDSENEIFDSIPKKYLRYLTKSIPVVPVRKIVECTDIRP